MSQFTFSRTDQSKKHPTGFKALTLSLKKTLFTKHSQGKKSANAIRTWLEPSTTSWHLRHKLYSKRHVLVHCFHSVGTRKLLSPPPWMSWANFRKQRKQQSYRLCFHLTFSLTVHNHKKRLTLLEWSFRNVGLDRDTLPPF